VVETCGWVGGVIDVGTETLLVARASSHTCVQWPSSKWHCYGNVNDVSNQPLHLQVIVTARISIVTVIYQLGIARRHPW